MDSTTTAVSHKPLIDNAFDRPRKVLPGWLTGEPRSTAKKKRRQEGAWHFYKPPLDDYRIDKEFEPTAVVFEDNFRYSETRNPGDDGQRLHSNVLGRIPGWKAKGDSPGGRDAVLATGRFFRPKKYQPNEYSCKYFEDSRYDATGWEFGYTVEPRIVKAFKTFRKPRRDLSPPPDLKEIMNRAACCLRMLEVDFDRFNECVRDGLFGRLLRTRSPERYYRWDIVRDQLRMVQYKQLGWLSRDVFGHRLHHPLASLSSPGRAFVGIGNEPEPMWCVDVKNCQFLMLAIEAGLGGAYDRRFFNYCESGQLYEHFSQELGVHRSVAKQWMIEELFRTRHGNQSRIGRIFQRDFPAVWSFADHMKTGKKFHLRGGEKKGYLPHARLAMALQRRESMIVIETALKNLFKQKKNAFAVPVHDALYVRKVDVELARSVLADALESYDVRPGEILKIESSLESIRED